MWSEWRCSTGSGHYFHHWRGPIGTGINPHNPDAPFLQVSSISLYCMWTDGGTIIILSFQKTAD